MLDQHVSSLLCSSNSNTLIVRSSSLFENFGRFQFSGLFNTYLNASSTKDVLVAIKKIVKNARSKALRSYFEEAGLNYRDIHMGVLVQEQIAPKFSGIAVLHRGKARIELTLDHSGALLQGASDAITILLDFNISPRITSIQNCPGEISFETLRSAITSLDLRLIQQYFGSCTMEFGLLESRAYLFQIRHDTQNNLHEKPEETSFFQERAVVGAKAFAMNFFESRKLFKHPLKLLPAGSTPSVIAGAISELLEKADTVTIRFSRDDELGLPRAFVRNLDEALLFINNNYCPSYSTIAHEYIDVVRSFELLIGHDFALLENVPGMWESESMLHPDVIRIAEGAIDILQFLRERPITLGRQLDNENDFTQPISPAEIDQFINLLDDVRESLLHEPSIALPVNVHAVLDEKTRSISCINIRPGFTLSERPVYATSFHMIRNEGDLAGWNGKSALRLSLRTARGSERQLISLAKALAKVRVPLIVDFGLLSHPAMLLREYGCKLIPSYRVPACIDEGSYRHVVREMDVGLDAYRRMMEESPVRVGLKYLILNDREPISKIHLLGLARKRSPSVVDSGQVSEVCDIFALYEEQAGGMFFYERGRAPFCTSGFSQSQDHFHLVGSLNLQETFDALSDQVEGKIFASLCEAYAHIKFEKGEYCVFGSDRTGFQAGRAHLGKRVLRNSAVTL